MSHPRLGNLFRAVRHCGRDEANPVLRNSETPHSESNTRPAETDATKRVPPPRARPPPTGSGRVVLRHDQNTRHCNDGRDKRVSQFSQTRDSPLRKQYPSCRNGRDEARPSRPVWGKRHATYDICLSLVHSSQFPRFSAFQLVRSAPLFSRREALTFPCGNRAEG